MNGTPSRTAQKAGQFSDLLRSALGESEPKSHPQAANAFERRPHARAPALDQDDWHRKASKAERPCAYVTLLLLATCAGKTDLAMLPFVLTSLSLAHSSILPPCPVYLFLLAATPERKIFFYV